MAKAGSGGGVLYADPPMSFQVTWALSAVDDTNFYVRISMSVDAGPYTVVGTTTTGATSFTFDWAPWVVGGGWDVTSRTYDIRVELIERATGNVADTSNATQLGLATGKCNSL